MKQRQPIITEGQQQRILDKVWTCVRVVPVLQDGEEPEFLYIFEGWGDHPICLDETQLSEYIQDS